MSAIVGDRDGPDGPWGFLDLAPGGGLVTPRIWDRVYHPDRATGRGACSLGGGIGIMDLSGLVLWKYGEGSGGCSPEYRIS